MIKNLIDRIKFPFRKDKELISELYSILGFYPHDVSLYRLALVHKSMGRKADEEAGGKNRGRGRGRHGRDARRDGRHDDRQPREALNNERLEYLGDAVLETVVSDIVFHHFPNKPEGFLTSTRSKIVQRESLNRLCALMEIDRLIRTAAGVDKIHTNVGGNAFEALMGAIYLDRGFQTCYWFVANRIVGRYILLDELATKEVNFKSKLLEWTQKNRIQIRFNDEQEGVGGLFATTVVLEGIIAGQGRGHNKKESQQAAAEETLKMLRRRASFKDRVFRAKESRTQLEADESFAVPNVEQAADGFIRSADTSKPVPTLDEAKGDEGARRGSKRGTQAALPESQPQLDDVEVAYAQAYAEEQETAQPEVHDFGPLNYTANAERVEKELAAAAAECQAKRNERRERNSSRRAAKAQPAPEETPALETMEAPATEVTAPPVSMLAAVEEVPAPVEEKTEAPAAKKPRAPRRRKVAASAEKAAPEAVEAPAETPAAVEETPAPVEEKAEAPAAKKSRAPRRRKVAASAEKAAPEAVEAPAETPAAVEETPAPVEGKAETPAAEAPKKPRRRGGRGRARTAPTVPAN